MSGHQRRGRRHRIEPARIQYGAWDDPRVSLFATVPQEPVGDMLGRLKRLPDGKRNRLEEMDACPLVLAGSADTDRLYREVKYQVQQIADDRNVHCHPIQERERQSALIARTMAEHNRREHAEAMRRKQLNDNSQRLRDLHTEIERAKTTLSVVRKRSENQRLQGSERAEEYKMALEQREQMRKEKLAEELALQQKSHTYGKQLADQICTLRQERAQKQQTDREEGRQKRQRDELAHANDLRQAIEWRHKKRDELKQMLDEFSSEQRKLRQASPDKQDKANVIVMEAVGPVTGSFIKQELQRRMDRIERRRQISDGLGQELSEMQRKKDEHDNMLADILICERQAREKKRAHQEIQKRHNLKLQVAKDLIGQQQEQQFYRDKDEALTASIPLTPTSFMERQYQQAADKKAASHALTVKTYDGIASDIVNNARLRETLMEEERKIKQALQEMEVDMERRIDEERLRVLHAQSREIIDEVRPCKLSHVERQTFNLPACGINDQDTHTK